MNVEGREFNFGRCMKIEFYKGNTLAMTVEHKPEVDRDYYIAMDVEVTDMPSPLAHDKPGFMGKITIFNPSRELLTLIADNATWLYNYVNPDAALAPRSMNKAQNEAGMKAYYASRLKAVIYAGYVVQGVPNYSRILGGYVNGSSFSHKMQDDILTLGVYDIDMTEISTSTIEQEDQTQILAKGKFPGSFAESKWGNKEKLKFAPTWHKTLEKYVREFETEWKDDEEGVFNIVYVKSLRAWLAAESKTNLGATVLDESLKAKLQAQKMPNGGVYAVNLAGMLNGLCDNAKTRVDWRKAPDNEVSINTYIIFPLGGSRTITSGETAGVQIWNYQNLLETPAIDGAGKMTIKMVFNPQCVCGKTIALMLSDGLGETDVTRNIASFESSIVKNGNLMGSMSSTGNDAAVANNQITGNTMVQALRKRARDANQTGYLFNTGFPIIKVEHKLSTYGPSWDTTVKTVPITAGLKLEGKK